MYTIINDNLYNTNSFVSISVKDYRTDSEAKVYRVIIMLHGSGAVVLKEGIKSRDEAFAIMYELQRLLNKNKIPENLGELFNKQEETE